MVKSFWKMVQQFFKRLNSFHQFSSVQSLSRVRLFVTPWIAAHQASLSITNSRSSLRLKSIESVMPFNHLILCHPLLLLPSIFPSIKVFSNQFSFISYQLQIYAVLAIKVHLNFITKQSQDLFARLHDVKFHLFIEGINQNTGNEDYSIYFSREAHFLLKEMVTLF